MQCEEVQCADVSCRDVPWNVPTLRCGWVRMILWMNRPYITMWVGEDDFVEERPYITMWARMILWRNVPTFTMWVGEDDFVDGT